MHTSLCNAPHRQQGSFTRVHSRQGVKLSGDGDGDGFGLSGGGCWWMLVDVGGKRKRDLDSGGIRTRAISDWCLKPAP